MTTTAFGMPHQIPQAPDYKPCPPFKQVPNIGSTWWRTCKKTPLIQGGCLYLQACPQVRFSMEGKLVLTGETWAVADWHKKKPKVHSACVKNTSHATSNEAEQWRKGGEPWNLYCEQSRSPLGVKQGREEHGLRGWFAWRDQSDKPGNPQMTFRA